MYIIAKFWAIHGHGGVRGTSIPGWPQDCAICLAPAQTRLVCEACAAGLVRVGHACARCALPLEAPAVCGACGVHPFAFDEARACFEYRFPVDRLIQRFKYAGDLALGRWLAHELSACVEDAPRPDLLVVPPLSPARLRERGFNQALEVARRVGARVRVPHAIGGLHRRRDTPAQAGLTRRERRENLQEAFACTLPLAGRHVAIVDDVLTTGATADALARVLKGRGAARVSVWAVARAPEPASR